MSNPNGFYTIPNLTTKDGHTNPCFDSNAGANPLVIKSNDPSVFIDVEIWKDVELNADGNIISGNLVDIAQRDVTQELDVTNVGKKGMNLVGNTITLKIASYDETLKEEESEVTQIDLTS